MTLCTFGKSISIYAAIYKPYETCGDIIYDLSCAENLHGCIRV